jgi:4-diphosphocytidyl-2-C-methyl-D-erythritol kinase
MAMPSLHDCPAPAKLNLFLHIVGRRADGYHLLQTVFQLLDYGDLLHFDVRADSVIRRVNDVPGVPEDADLVVRAARLLQAAVPGLPGADIRVEKHLPMGGGLGGGSSDAATTLMVLNHLWQAGLSREELMALGLKLGADVPFFIFGSNAFAEGVGEQLTAVDGLDCWFVVLEPGVAVPTPAIFCSPELTRNTKPVRIADFSGALQNAFGKNDMQAVAARLFPEVDEALSWLGRFGNARMTGSGGCVFMPCQSEQQADAVLEAASGGWKSGRAWKARGIAKHPLSGLQVSL